MADCEPVTAPVSEREKLAEWAPLLATLPEVTPAPPGLTECALMDFVAEAILEARWHLLETSGRALTSDHAAAVAVRAILAAGHGQAGLLAAKDAEIERLREALRPFASAYDEHVREHEIAAAVGGWIPMEDDYPLDGVLLGHFARARAILDGDG